MSRQFISTCFSIIFLVLITAPSIIVLVDDSADISIFYESSEEEEKGNEKNKEIEVFISELNQNEFNLDSSKLRNKKGYCFKNYPKPHLNLIFPPPEHIIL